MFRIGLLLLFLTASSQLQAGWITWTNGTPGVTATGVFAGATGVLGGTIAASISNVTDGLGNGVPGLDARVYTNAQLTPTFTANLPVNSDGSFTVLANSYNDSQDAYTISLDFSGMTNGYLPAGSIFTILDLDIQENYRNVTGFDAAGTQIVTNWLASMTGPAGLMDWIAAGGDQTGSVAGITSSFSGGVYQFLGATGNDNSALVGFRITQDLRGMTLRSDKSNNSSASGGTGGPGFAIGTSDGTSDVPEPASMALAGVFLCGLMLFRRRDR